MSGRVREDEEEGEYEGPRWKDEEKNQVIPEREEEPVPVLLNSSQEEVEDESKMEEDENEVLASSFPVMEMSRLDEMISNPRWVVPVLPGGQLEILLDAAINLSKRGKVVLILTYIYPRLAAGRLS
jgi:hypothetical protein